MFPEELLLLLDASVGAGVLVGDGVVGLGVVGEGVVVVPDDDVVADTNLCERSGAGRGYLGIYTKI